MRSDKHNKLIEALRTMKHSGEDGFEGLVATLLEKILKERFVVARSGSQPGGDAGDIHGRISLETKRYGDGTPPNINEIEGSIQQTIRSLPDLECCVFAISREAEEQLRARLRNIADTNEKGVDIIVLDHKDTESDIISLCVTYWDSISHFEKISSLENEFAEWAEKESRNDKLIEKVLEIKKQISECTSSYDVIRKNSIQRINERFGIKPVERLFSYDIQVENAVRRPAIEKAVSEWWSENSRKTAYLEGEEGTGKSWAAALSAINIVKSEKPIVFWLDSVDWAGCRNIDELMGSALRKIEKPLSGRIPKLVKKAFSTWKDPILLILDGVNERDAIETANLILRDIDYLNLPHLRVLFTTRLLQNLTHKSRKLWDVAERIEVNEYDDAEFSDALNNVDSPLKIEDVPEELRPYMRRARLFEACVPLIDRFRGVSNITRELILWEYLKVKIEDDPHIFERLGLTSEDDAAAVLSKLAENVVKQDDLSIVNKEIMDYCFDNKYESIRQDIEESGIAEKAEKFNACINPLHIKLGWALLILDELRKTKEIKSTFAFVDDIRALIEPIPSDDIITEAIYTALMLSVNDTDRLGEPLYQKRAALLYSWFFSHNADIKVEKLDFWANEDIAAYLEFIDTFFHDLYDSEVQISAFYPLAKVWKQSAPDMIKNHINRWLLLVRSPEIDGTEYFEYKGHEFPVADNYDHLRLSALAVSLISLRPEPEFIKTLALSMATYELSFYKNDDSKRYLKDIRTNIGILLRWSYTERIIPTIQSIVDSDGTEEDELLIKGLGLLKKSLGIWEPAELLENEQRIMNIRNASVSNMHDLVKEGKPLFDIRTLPGRMGEMAVRADLPELMESDKAEIYRRFKAVCNDKKPKSSLDTVDGDIIFDMYLPWVARYSPEKMAELMGRLKVKALEYENPFCFFLKTHGIFHSVPQDANINETIASGIISDTEKMISESIKDRGSRIRLYYETMLLYATPEKLKQWFDLISSDENARSSITLYHNLLLMKLLLPQDVSEYAGEKVMAAYQKYSEADAQNNVTSEFGFWSFIAASVQEPDDLLFQWAKGQIIENGAGHPANYSLFFIAASRGSDEWLNDILDDDNLFPLIDERAVAAIIECKRPFPVKIKTERAYEYLMGILPKDFAGLVMTRSGRVADFNRWGYELFETVCGKLPDQHIELEADSSAEYILNNDGSLDRIRQKHPLDHVEIRYNDSSIWGVTDDSENVEKHLQILQGDNSALKRESELWRKDRERINQWSYSWINKIRFFKLLMIWSETNMADFLCFAKAYLDQLEKSEFISPRMESFTNDLLCIYLQYAPDRAVDIYNRYCNRFQVKRSYGTDEFMMSLWDIERCGTSRHDEIRKGILDDKWLNDFEIMKIAFAAVANSSEKYLLDLLKAKYVGADIARERCLAVSFLPWLNMDEAIDLLRDLKENDPNKWVRDHADWSYDVAMSERCCRGLYRKALCENDTMKISAILQQIKPALTPAALLWKGLILNEEKEKNSIPENKVNYALRDAYWRNLKNKLEKAKVNGRDLTRYYRGEKIDSHIMSRLAPWWDVEIEQSIR